MRYDNPQLQEALAGAYVAGSLHGPARRRFEALMRTRPDLRRRVEAWEDRLTPLSDTIPAVPPPAQVWHAVRQRIAPGKSASTQGGVWGSLAFWRPFGALAACLAVIAAVYAGYTTFQPAQKPQVAGVASQQITPSYVAVLTDKSDSPALVVTAFKGPWRLTVEPLREMSPYAGKVFQVWAVERGTGTTRPLIQVAGNTVLQQRLGDVGWDAIKTSESLIVTVEDAGEAPAAPSGEAIFSGLCLNLKGPAET
ncbi:MAG: anti-sigma factor [Kiloniellaceae bacterium]